jgi:hypothetical protein
MKWYVNVMVCNVIDCNVMVCNVMVFFDILKKMAKILFWKKFKISFQYLENEALNGLKLIAGIIYG